MLSAICIRFASSIKRCLKALSLIMGSLSGTGVFRSSLQASPLKRLPYKMSVLKPERKPADLGCVVPVISNPAARIASTAGW